MSKTESSGLTVFGENEVEIRAAFRDSLNVLSAEGFCVYGQYPWDAWQGMARMRGVPEELAVLGRAVMREAHQHMWSERLKSLCGWNDEGRRMIALALRRPKTARLRWEWLLETDGQRVDENHEWVGEDSRTWARKRRRWLKENGKELER